MRALIRRRQLGQIIAAVIALGGGLSCDGVTPPIGVDSSVKFVMVKAKADSILKTTGDTARFVATATDASGNVITGRKVTWSVSDPSLATVDDAGLVTSVVLTGSTTVRAAIDGVVGTAPVTLKQLAATIVVTPATANFTSIGDTVRFTAVATDAKGNAMPILKWASAVPSRVSIDSTGLATALANGAATVVVYAGPDVFARNTKAVPMNIDQVPVAIRMGPTTYTFTSIGETAQFRDTIFDARGNPILGRKASTWWSTDSRFILVGGSGLATAKANGKATVVVANGALSARVPVSLVQRPVSSVAFSAPVGSRMTVSSPSKDALGNLVAFTEPVTWTSSDPSIASVTPDGIVTANQTGSTTLIATSGAITATTTFNVTATLPDTLWTTITLTRAGSPYLITRNLIVASGATLRIDPGVVIKVDGQRIIVIKGGLEAFGTVTDSIHFMSARPTPISGDWIGILFDVESVRSKLAADGSYLSGSGMSYVDIGHAWTVTYRQTAYLANSRVHDMIVAGVTVSGVSSFAAAGTIRENTIEDNASAGISIDGSGASGLVQRNIIRRNKHGGIQTGRGMTIEDNTITQNEEGFYGAGIGISGGASTIRFNDITGNVLHGPPHNGAGIGLFAGGSAAISNNNIESNVCVPTGSNANAAPECSAVWFYGVTGTLSNNNLANSGPFELFLDHPSSAVSASSNYWNTSSTDVTAKVMTASTNLTPILSPVLTSRITPNGPRTP